MQTEQFNVKNVKCGGCAGNIRNGLSGMPGVATVDVEVETGRVTVEGEGLSRDAIAQKLKELGYPEV